LEVTRNDARRASFWPGVASEPAFSANLLRLANAESGGDLLKTLFVFEGVDLIFQFLQSHFLPG
jgi:hypothetical protein